MKVTTDQITAGVMAYFEREVQPHLPNDGWRGFGVGFFSTLAASRIGSIVTHLMAHPAVALLDIVDEAGMVDIDELYAAAVKAMPESGIQLQVMGNLIRFSRADLKMLRDMIAQK